METSLFVPGGDGPPIGVAQEPEIAHEKSPAPAKDQLARQFRQWLEQRADLSQRQVEPANTTRLPDLYSLFAELIALKNEVKIESRQFKNAFEQHQKTLELLESGYHALEKEQQVNKTRKQEIRFLVARQLILEILEVRDRIEDSLKAIRGLKPKMLRRRYRKKRPVLDSIARGQSMLLHRIEQLLQNNGVAPIPVVGAPFDPHTMRAVDVVRDAKKENDVVVAEIRRGFTLHNEVIRIAEVQVNKHPIEPDHESN